jgi:hypothetical protein
VLHASVWVYAFVRISVCLSAYTCVREIELESVLTCAACECTHISICACVCLSVYLYVFVCEIEGARDSHCVRKRVLLVHVCACAGRNVIIMIV